MDRKKLAQDTIRPVLVLLILFCSLISVHQIWQGFPSFAASIRDFLEWNPVTVHGLALAVLATVPICLAWVAKEVYQDSKSYGLVAACLYAWFMSGSPVILMMAILLVAWFRYPMKRSA